MHVRILDLDGSATAQLGIGISGGADVVDLRQWGPAIRLGCSFARWRRFRESLPAHPGKPTVHFLGSGDFHHVSLALLGQIREPINLVVIDKHPDWMRFMPVMHCGTWLSHAVRLPHVERIFHIGGDLDFDNAWQRFAPWPELRSGKIVVIPAVRRFVRGAWKAIPHEPVRVRREEPTSRDRIDELLRPHEKQLRSRPVYISFDKDALTTDDAIVNWDSGYLELSETIDILDAIRERAQESRVAGMGIVGDWSPVKVRGWLRHFLHRTEHPNLSVEADRAIRTNSRTNARLLAWIAAGERK